MAKDSRKIYSGVRLGDKVYTEGMEDELEAVLTPQQVEYLTEQNAIEGFKVKTEKPEVKK